MPTKQRKSKSKNAPSERKAASEVVHYPPPRPTVPPVPIPTVEAFLDEARNERKRILVTDHIDTIKVLRDEKRFTFRGIAEWLTARGIETDHSAVYRAYLASIPEENRHPDQDWSDVDEPE